MTTPRKTISNGHLYVARVRRSTLPDGTEVIDLSVGRDEDVFSVEEGSEFVTFVTPAPLFTDER